MEGKSPNIKAISPVIKVFVGGIPPLKLFYNTSHFKVFFSFGRYEEKTKSDNKKKIFMNLKIADSAKMQKIIITKT